MKILIIDEQKMYADGIQNLLEAYDQSFEIEYAQNLFIAHDKISQCKTLDLIILSVNDSFSENSYDLMSKVNTLNYKIPTIICSASNSPVAVAKALENNAAGYISKSYSPEVTLDAILSVLRGDMFISIENQQLSENKVIPEPDINNVTARQLEVLSLLSQGLLNKQIANELDISPNTVKIHLSDLFRKLKVTNRTAAVKNGYEGGLI